MMYSKAKHDSDLKESAQQEKENQMTDENGESLSTSAMVT